MKVITQGVETEAEEHIQPNALEDIAAQIDGCHNLVDQDKSR